MFTPFLSDGLSKVGGLTIFDISDDRIRVKVELNEEDSRLWDQMRKRSDYKQCFVDVTDQGTGIKLRVKPADCGAGCYCAAEVTDIFENPLADAWSNSINALLTGSRDGGGGV